MSRAASAIEATQVSSATQSAYNAKLNNLERTNRSGAQKNHILLQSHYGLSAGNTSAFGFHQGKKFRGLNSSNNKQFAQINNDHAALKQFAIEQLCKFLLNP